MNEYFVKVKVNGETITNIVKAVSAGEIKRKIYQMASEDDDIDIIDIRKV